MDDMSTAQTITVNTITGKCLIAMPSMDDPNFARAVVYICAHTPEGAMGLVVNRAFPQLSFPDILEQLNIESTPACERIRVHFGGPVEAARGFVLHSAEYAQAATLLVNDGVALTATTDVLRAMAQGTGPRRSLMALGYAGWGSGQLDNELKENAWLVVDADEDLLFGNAIDTKWTAALGRLGIDPAMLSDAAGHA